MLNQPRKLVLLAGDLACLHLALTATLLLRYAPEDWTARWQSHWPYFLPVFFIWLVILYINNLYNLNLAGGNGDFYRSLLNAVTASTIASVLYFYLNLRSAVAPRTNLAIFIVGFIIIFYLWRRLYRTLVSRVLSGERLAVIGSPEQSAQLLKEITANPGAGYRPELIVNQSDGLEEVSRQIVTRNIKTLVIAENFGPPVILNRLLSASWRYDIAIFDYAEFYERLTGKVPIEDIAASWFLKNVKTGQKKYFDWLKQVTDYLLAGIVLIVTLPFWLFIAAAIRLASPGPVFFRQERLGRDGRPFTIIKFRTMTADARSSIEAAEKKELIRGGRFLRETRLDELPQLINILRGEMSFIGPRPEQPQIAAERERQIPFYRMRLLVKPGLTGWDQISGDYHSSSLEHTAEKLQYDLFYLKQRSLYLDAAIALKTLATIMSRNGR